MQYESVKLSIQDILERKDKQMEAKMQKIKQENDKLNALIMKKAAKSNLAGGQQVRQQDMGMYGQNANAQSQAMYQNMMYQQANMGYDGVQAQNMYAAQHMAGYGMGNAYAAQNGAMGYNPLTGRQEDLYRQQANGNGYNHGHEQNGRQ